MEMAYDDACLLRGVLRLIGPFQQCEAAQRIEMIQHEVQDLSGWCSIAHSEEYSVDLSGAELPLWPV